MPFRSKSKGERDRKLKGNSADNASGESLKGLVLGF
jgi:hypothetical protein